MSKSGLIYQAKDKMIELSVKIAKFDSHGMDTDCLVCDLLRMKSYSLTLERYNEVCKKDKVKNGYLYLDGKKILLSENNNYFCNTEEKINVNDLYLNCLTEEEVCKVAKDLINALNC
jgi:hypothetical protein